MLMATLPFCSSHPLTGLPTSYTDCCEDKMDAGGVINTKIKLIALEVGTETGLDLKT